MMEYKNLNFREFLDNNTQFSDWEIERIYLSDPTVKVHELANKTNRSIGEIYRILNRSGSRPNRQIINHENVKMFSNSGLAIKDVAELTGYTPRNVRYILKRKK